MLQKKLVVNLMKSKKKIVLAYSGGLDTSIILKWLQQNYDAEVICYTADVGQEIDRKKIITNAKKFGVKNIIIKDLKDTFVKDYVYPMIRGHAIYEGVYLLGTSIARPLIAKIKLEWLKNLKLMQFRMVQLVKEMIKLDLNWDIIILALK
jgi:argininosuccinate synthase